MGWDAGLGQFIRMEVQVRSCDITSSRSCSCVIVIVISDVWFPIKIQHGTVGMTDIKLKCGSPGCDYLTEEVSAEIAWVQLQFHRQDITLQRGSAEYSRTAWQGTRG